MPRTAFRRPSSRRCGPTRGCGRTPTFASWVMTIAHRKALDSPSRAHPTSRYRWPSRQPSTHARRRRRRRPTRSCGRPSGAARAPALGGRAALRRRPSTSRDRGGDRLLGGGGAALAARGTVKAEKGGAGMTNENGALERALTRSAAEPGADRRGPALREAAEAAAGVTAQSAARKACSTSPTQPSTRPSARCWRRARERGLLRLAFPEEGIDPVLEQARRARSRRGSSSRPPPGAAAARAGRVLRRAQAALSDPARLVADRPVRGRRC